MVSPAFTINGRPFYTRAQRRGLLPHLIEYGGEWVYAVFIPGPRIAWVDVDWQCQEKGYAYWHVAGMAWVGWQWWQDGDVWPGERVHEWRRVSARELGQLRAAHAERAFNARRYGTA